MTLGGKRLAKLVYANPSFLGSRLPCDMRLELFERAVRAYRPGLGLGVAQLDGFTNLSLSTTLLVGAVVNLLGLYSS